MSCPIARLLARALAIVLLAGPLVAAPAQAQEKTATSGLAVAGPVVHGTPDDPLRDPREKHLKNVKQLTFGGQNAEAYFSYDGRRIIFMSTHLAGDSCPPRPDYSQGYVWAVYSSYQIYYATDDGKIQKPLTKGPGYNAEATLSSDGKMIVFTSSRDGDLDIYTMKADGTGLRRLTNTVGYDGGPVFSPDGKWIAYRANHPSGEQEIARYKSLLARDLVEPNEMDLYFMRADGSDQQQITKLAGASFAPSFFPDSRRILFASNYENPGSSRFELYAINRDSSALEQITQVGGFNAFPQFSPDGKKLVFISNRGAKVPHELNVFVADWVP